jgi:hypothetical protein
MHQSLERTEIAWVDEKPITLNALFQGSKRLEIISIAKV